MTMTLLKFAAAMGAALLISVALATAGWTAPWLF